MKSIIQKTIVLFLLFNIYNLAAQDPATIQIEIDRQVWKPFKRAFENLDAEALNATYADDVLRVTPEGIDTKNAFKIGNLERFNQNKADGIKIKLDFWFDSRHTNSEASYEVGFYRIKFITKENRETIVYGQFHIVLKKIGRNWKITQDWDTTLIGGDEINAKDFAKKPPYEFY